MTSAILWLLLVVLGVLSGSWHTARGAESASVEPGMVLLVQAILHAGSCEGEVLSDQWAIRSKDGLPAVAMLRMVLIDEDKAIPLTNLRTTRVSDSLEREGSVS